MILKKPLLFIYPLSPSLQKYLEFAKGSAEEEGFEIYELDILGEALQLVPTVGAALLLGSSPKKIAQILQTTRKVLQNNSSKVLLLTDKELPIKLVQKMQKIGLTEYLPEPVNPKTLIYKVGLLLKSLPTNDFDKQENSESDVLINKSEIQQTEEKQRIEKGIISDTVVEDLNLEEKPAIELAIESKRTEKNKVDDLLLSADTKNKKEELENLVETKGNEIDDSPDVNSEQAIETYYKTINEDKIEIDIEQSPTSTNITEKESLSDETSRISDGNLNIKLEKAKNEAKKDDSPLTLTQKKTSKNENNNEEKVPVAQDDDETELLLFEIEQAKKNIQNDALEESKKAKQINNEKNLLNNNENKTNKSSVGELLIETLPSNSEEDEESDLDSIYQLKRAKKTSALKEQERKGKVDSELTLQTDKKLSSLKPEKNEGELSLEEMKLTSLELSKKEVSDTEVQIKEKERDNTDAHELNLSTGIESSAERNELDIVSAESDASGKKEKTDNDDGPVTLTDSENLELSKGKSEGLLSTDLLLESNDEQEAKSSLLVENKKTATNNKLVAESTEDIEVKDKQNDTLRNEAKLKKEKTPDLILQSSPKESHTKNQSEYEWSNINREKKEIIDDRWVGRKKETVELVFEKDVRPGDVIDYRKLKKMFEHTDTIERSKKNTKNDSTNSNPNESDQNSTSTHFDDLFVQSNESIDSETEQETAIKTLFAGETNGVEFIVRVLQLYLDKRSDINILLYLSNVLYRRYSAFGGFFIINKDGTCDEFFSSAHQIEYSGDRQVLIAQWEELKKESRENWRMKSIPTWEDDTFTLNKNNFTYPFFDGIDQIGFAHFSFPEAISKAQSTPLEMMIESTRSIYLERLKKNEKPKEKEDIKATEKQKAGFFSSFFGKKKDE